MAKLSAQELADLVPCQLDEVRRLEALGLLEPPDGDGLFQPSDVHVVRLMSAFEAAGISLEDVALGVAAGELSFPLGRFMPEPVGTSETWGTSASAWSYTVTYSSLGATSALVAPPNARPLKDRPPAGNPRAGAGTSR